MRFRHLLEQHQLGEQLFATVNQVLEDRGLLTLLTTLGVWARRRRTSPS